MTYGTLAERADRREPRRLSARRWRAIPGRLSLPCHRVLAAGNKPGGFSAPGGLITKAKLLAMEGVYLDGGEPMLPGLFD